MRESSKDKVEGKGSQIKGVLKEKTGKAIKNDKMAKEGREEKTKGYFKEKRGKFKERL